MTERPMLIVVRVDHMWRAHPQTDFTRVCARCGERVGIYPSGQQFIRDHLDTEIVCDVCVLRIAQDEILITEPLPGVVREACESVDITKKKQ
jgi:DNA-directed RNA polymerase subunit RPC12/RpoP